MVRYSTVLTDVRDDVVNSRHAVRMTCTKLTEGLLCYGLVRRGEVWYCTIIVVWYCTLVGCKTDVCDEVINSRNVVGIACTKLIEGMLCSGMV